METLEAYLESLASAEPVPGGGSAAAIVASTGAALVGMVARICARNPKYAAHAQLTSSVAAESDELRRGLETARARDERAFANVVAAQALPKATDDDRAARRAELDRALREAAEEPLATAALALAVLRLAERILGAGNANLASDVGCAAEFAASALAACAYNVRVNHRYLRDAAAVAAQAGTLAGYEAEAETGLARVRAAVAATLTR